MNRHMIYESHSTGERPRYCVWESGSLGTFHYAVASPQEGAQLIREIALEQLKNPDVVWNAFGLIELEDDEEYHEWYDEAGNDIDSLVGL